MVKIGAFDHFYGLKWSEAIGYEVLLQDGEHLLNNPDVLLYIPVTQEPPIMTEYTLEKETQFLEQLGTTSDASELRMMIQSRTLLSDMECFKAANPGCILEDFIRWYSPRDWDSDDKRELSPSPREQFLWSQNQTRSN